MLQKELILKRENELKEEGYSQAFLDITTIINHDPEIWTIEDVLKFVAKYLESKEK